MKEKISSLIKFYTILLLNKKSKYGYELINELEEKLERKISASQIYPFLKILKKNNLIKIKEIGKRKKKVYILTQKGKKFTDNFIKRFAELIDIAIEPKLTVCAHCGCRVYKGGYKEKIKGIELMFCCIYCAESYKKIN